MTVTRYEVVRRTVTKSGRCPVCHGRTQRRRTFTETVNPFNRNDNGSPCTLTDIQLHLLTKTDLWQPDYRHLDCAS